MEEELNITKKGLTIIYTTPINQTIENKTIKDKKYTSKQYHITLPPTLQKYYKEYIFLEEKNTLQYKIHDHDRGACIKQKITKKHTKKYNAYRVTLPKKHFKYLDDKYTEEAQVKYTCTVEEGELNVIMDIIL